MKASKPLRFLSNDLQLFGTQITTEINELKRNVEVRPVTGATLYRHCLEDLDTRLTSISEDVGALESVSLDAISLELRSLPLYLNFFVCCLQIDRMSS